MHVLPPLASLSFDTSRWPLTTWNEVAVLPLLTKPVGHLHPHCVCVAVVGLVKQGRNCCESGWAGRQDPRVMGYGEYVDVRLAPQEES